VTAPPVRRNPDLTGALLRVQRAKKHLAEFDARTRPVLAAWAGALVTNYDRERAEYVISIGELPAIPPDLSAIIGDAIHNLRISLDYLAWELVIATGQQPNRRTCFPVHQRRRRGQAPSCLPDILPGVPAQMRRLLDEVQPYHSSEFPHKHPLALLHDLDIVDKHHQILVPIYATLGYRGGHEVDLGFFNAGPYENGSNIMSDVFRSDPAYQRRLIADRKDPVLGPILKKLDELAGKANAGTKRPLLELRPSQHDPGDAIPTPLLDFCIAGASVGAWDIFGASDLVRVLLQYVVEDVFPRFTVPSSP